MKKLRNNTPEPVRAVFTKQMKKTHTILAPNMLPIHFDLIARVLRQDGYSLEILKTTHPGVVEEGLRNVHNDTCYPALLVIGQFMDALKSGKYDTNKVALLLMQTGGGCRASNYISLLRKALEQNGFGHVPVISLNFSKLEKNSGFSLKPGILVKIVYALQYADLLMCLHNQCVPYETAQGDTQAVVDRWERILVQKMNGPGFMRLAQNCRDMLQDFSKIPMDRTRQKIKVGIVGEIYLKFAPLGNNDLEKYLVSEGAEVVNSGLMDFLLYCLYNSVYDKEIYGKGGLSYHGVRFAIQFLERGQLEIIEEVRRHSMFTPPVAFRELATKSEGYIGHGVKMGEGWLLTAEMVEYIHSGVNNIVSAQPFGCLPNHIVAKGMIRKIKDNHPQANIVAVDYDPGASRINQENRLKLMLANAKLAGGLSQLEYTVEETEAERKPA